MIGQRFDMDWLGGRMAKHERGDWVRYDDFEAVMDALQRVLRRDCAWQNGYYDMWESKTLREAIGVLVGAGRVRWLDAGFRVAKDVADDKEQQ